MLTAQCHHYLNSPNVETTQKGVLVLKVVSRSWVYIVQAEAAVPLSGEMVTVRTLSYERVKENDPSMSTMGYFEARILFLWAFWETPDMNSFSLNRPFTLQKTLRPFSFYLSKLEEAQHSELGEMAWKPAIPGKKDSKPYKQHHFLFRKGLMTFKKSQCLTFITSSKIILQQNNLILSGCECSLKLHVNIFNVLKVY